MERRDYVLREIERLGYFLARVRDRVLGRTTSLAELKRDLHAAAPLLGADLELAHRVTPETLLMLIAPGVDMDVTKTWFYAESFYLEGLEARIEGDDEGAEELFSRARLLYSALDGGRYHILHVSEAADRIREIDRLLSDQDYLPDPAA